MTNFFDHSYFDPNYFAASSSISLSGISDANSNANSSLLFGVKGESEGVSDNNVSLNAQYFFIASIIANSNALTYPQMYYNLTLNAGAVLTITKSNIASDILDREIFNNDPDVAVDEYVLLFKRKP